MNESPSERAATDAQIRQHPSFTPAPWDMHEDTAIIGGRGLDVFAIESHTRPIVQIPAPASWDHAEYGEVKANAHLITAAPAMYDLLGDIEKFLGDLTKGYDLYERCGIVRAQARGEVAAQ